MLAKGAHQRQFALSRIPPLLQGTAMCQRGQLPPGNTHGSVTFDDIYGRVMQNMSRDRGHCGRFCLQYLAHLQRGLYRVYGKGINIDSKKRPSP